MTAPVGSRATVVIGAITCVCLVAVAQVRRWVEVRSYDATSLPICRVATDVSAVALSFDDGPNERFTRPILSILGRFGATATFFTVGRRVAAEPDLVRAEISAAMEVGDHTWSHPHLGSVTPVELRSQLARTDEALWSATGSRSALFRAPFGEIDASGLGIVGRAGLRSIGWSLAADRYLHGGTAPEQAARDIAAALRPGDIILAHDAGADRSATVEMLGPLLERLRSDGIRVVTVGQLLALGDPVRGVPRRWFWQSGFSCPS